ncbi:MAG TPA: PEP-CTERM sorting domain-containing protein [Vicinamibacterales bacterium]|nr:PEP-CTERM sorting domain-containing protein [Vicinamibacterales bacterium]
MRVTTTSIALAATLTLASFAAPVAQATPLCAGPPVPGAPSTITNGSTCGLTASTTPINVMFVGFSAGDTDALRLPGVTPDPIFVNQGGGATPIGTVVSLNVVPGNLAFELDDTTSGQTFTMATAYANSDASSSTVYHFANFTFTTGATDADDEVLYDNTFPGATMTAGEFSFIEANGGFAAWTFSGVEDRTVATTDDWNDLVYAFENVAPTTTSVPEPLTLSVFGAGLAGLGWLRARRARKA